VKRFLLLRDVTSGGEGWVVPAVYGRFILHFEGEAAPRIDLDYRGARQWAETNPYGVCLVETTDDEKEKRCVVHDRPMSPACGHVDHERKKLVAVRL
jgi:hypothetical protein